MDPLSWDRAALDATAEWLGEVGTTQFLVVDHGETVTERFWAGSDPTTAMDVGSIQKPLTSVVVGTLIDEGRLDLELPASTWLGRGWTRCGTDDEDRVLLRHLMSMTSGLHDDFSFEAAPGTLWYYNNHAYHQVRRVIEIVTGATTAEVFADRIFDPAGMTDSSWVDRTTLDPTGRPLAGLHTTARDLASFATSLMTGRFGLSDGYRAAMTAPSQELNPAYGLLWWNHDATRALTPGLPTAEERDRRMFSTAELRRRIAPSAPPGMVGGTGMGEQRLHLIPDREIVVVRLGRMPRSGGPFDEALWSRLSPALPNRGAS